MELFQLFDPSFDSNQINMEERRRTIISFNQQEQNYIQDQCIICIIIIIIIMKSFPTKLPGSMVSSRTRRSKANKKEKIHSNLQNGNNFNNSRQDIATLVKRVTKKVKRVVILSITAGLAELFTPRNLRRTTFKHLHQMIVIAVRLRGDLGELFTARERRSRQSSRSTMLDEP